MNFEDLPFFKIFAIPGKDQEESNLNDGIFLTKESQFRGLIEKTILKVLLIIKVASSILLTSILQPLQAEPDFDGALISLPTRMSYLQGDIGAAVYRMEYVQTTGTDEVYKINDTEQTHFIWANSQLYFYDEVNSTYDVNSQDLAFNQSDNSIVMVRNAGGTNPEQNYIATGSVTLDPILNPSANNPPPVGENEEDASHLHILNQLLTMMQQMKDQEALDDVQVLATILQDGAVNGSHLRDISDKLENLWSETDLKPWLEVLSEKATFYGDQSVSYLYDTYNKLEELRTWQVTGLGNINASLASIIAQDTYLNSELINFLDTTLVTLHNLNHIEAQQSRQNIVTALEIIADLLAGSSEVELQQGQLDTLVLAIEDGSEQIVNKLAEILLNNKDGLFSSDNEAYLKKIFQNLETKPAGEYLQSFSDLNLGVQNIHAETISMKDTIKDQLIQNRTDILTSLSEGKSIQQAGLLDQAQTPYLQRVVQLLEDQSGNGQADEPEPRQVGDVTQTAVNTQDIVGTVPTVNSIAGAMPVIDLGLIGFGDMQQEVRIDLGDAKFASFLAFAKTLFTGLAVYTIYTVTLRTSIFMMAV